ncbi:MAG: 3-deoxy-D-manno-octulosonic acid transferase [Flavobacteriales bacterium]|nr:3-deoxy-D-manno-octulosonic acid transferase [Flavobacteriales bacterium]
MKTLYNISIALYGIAIKVAAAFGSSKAKLWVRGRKDLWSRLENEIGPNDRPLVWIHAASLGEYEMAKPIIELYRKEHSSYRILLTLFSPSGYEYLKNKKVADHIFYLPLDTRSNARKFLKITQPSKAIFIKNEIWLNHLAELENNAIPRYLVSGIFRVDQIYFRPYGSLFKNALSRFDHIFVQDEASADLLKKNSLENVLVTGDTRMDRTFQNSRETEFPPFLRWLKNDKITLILGSSWEKEEELAYQFYMEKKDQISLIIAPHDISEKRINSIIEKFKEVTLLSELTDGDQKVKNVIIVDTMGDLMMLYRIADLAFIGGGWRNGLHNILEPAAFGLPVIFGPMVRKFPEAERLIQGEAAFKVKDQEDFNKTMKRLISDSELRLGMGERAKAFIASNLGAAEKTMSFIERKN